MSNTDSKKFKASCLILAGGKGTRLTPDKPLLMVNGKSIIELTVGVVDSLFEEVIIVTNTPDKYRFLGLTLVPDERKDCGPLMGIYSGLRKIKYDAAFVCAADMPFLNKDIIRAQYHELAGYDIVVPSPRGKPEFLHAFYRNRCLPVMKETLDADQFKIEMITNHCKTLRLDGDWFEVRGLTDQLDMAFTNINTAQDYESWQAKEKKPPPRLASPRGDTGLDAFKAAAPQVFQEIRDTLVEQETLYQHNSEAETFSSLWAHSSRVGRIAHQIAKAEGLEPVAALLAGLLHDTGKFDQGKYHEDDIPEERTAAGFAERILSNTVYDEWIPLVKQAILSMYLEGEVTTDLGRVIHDADNLDKLGFMGVAQFFSKNTLRHRFLDDDLLVRASIELTYAHHAVDTLKTATARELAREREARTRTFYTGLLQEWAQLGLGAFHIIEENIGGIVCLMVVPNECACGGELELHTDIVDAIKCRSVVVEYPCAACGRKSEYSFCLPSIKGLPDKPSGREKA